MALLWVTSTSKSALPGSSPCLMLPQGNLSGLLLVNKGISQEKKKLNSSRLSVAHLTNPFLFLSSFFRPSQLCRTVPRARTETNGARLSTLKIFKNSYLAYVKLVKKSSVRFCLHTADTLFFKYVIK